jgi:predicted MFS family arabinose efflux permease
MVILTTLAFCFALPLIAITSSAATLAAALFFFGASAGSMDVAMNVEGAALEGRYGRPIMSAFHGLFSVGGMLGAALGGAIAASGLTPISHFTWGAVFFAILTVVCIPWIPIGASDVGSALGFRFTRTLFLLGALAFCILVGEGAMADWAALYLHNSLGTGPGTAALGYAVFSATMSIGRLTGDRLAVRIGRIRIVRVGSLIAAAGLAGALLFATVPAAMIGLACVGAGFSTIIPIVFGAGANVKNVAPGAGVAAVTTAGYLGFLLGPPLIGFTAEYTSLRTALAVVVVLSLIGSMLANATGTSRENGNAG